MNRQEYVTELESRICTARMMLERTQRIVREQLDAEIKPKNYDTVSIILFGKRNGIDIVWQGDAVKTINGEEFRPSFHVWTTDAEGDLVDIDKFTSMTDAVVCLVTHEIEDYIRSMVDDDAYARQTMADMRLADVYREQGRD